jgi:hypothetical protein
MRKIFWGLTLLVILLVRNSYSAEDNKPTYQVYCLDTDDYYTISYIHVQGAVERKRACFPTLALPYRIEIPKSVFNKLQNEATLWFNKGGVDDPSDSSFFRKSPLRTNPEFIRQKHEALERIHLESKNEIAAFHVLLDQEIKRQEIATTQKNKETEDKKFKLKFSELEKSYSGKCNWGYTKGTEKYNNCLLEQEKKTLAEQKKNQDLAEVSKKKSESESKQISEKLAKMTPDDRRAYTCSEKFGFRKGSDKFKDCVFKIYSAEIELEKLELQKQLAKANADLARANSDRQDRLALAQTETARMQAYAAQQQAISANTADSLSLIESGLRMMSPQRPAAAPMRTCTYTGRFMNCF